MCDMLLTACADWKVILGLFWPSLSRQSRWISTPLLPSYRQKPPL